MDEITLIVLASIIVWIVISTIVGNFGASRSIGFTGAFFASLLLSPILAMLFILASDKTGSGKITAGNKALFIVPIIICVLIPLGINASDNKWEHEYEVTQTQDKIDFLSSLTQEDFEGGDYYRKEFNPYKLDYYKLSLRNDNYWNYDDLTWESAEEINEWRTNELKRLNTIIAQNTNLGLKAFF